jgi:hypothetical protein
MLEQIAKKAALLLVGCLLLSSCSHFSKSARQQRAYERYVRKTSGIHMKHQAKLKGVRMPPTPVASQPQVTTEVSDSPQSMSSNTLGNE